MTTEIPDNINILSIPPEVLNARRPKILYTDSYLNDPIQFNVEQRLVNDSLTKQIENLIPSYTRDITGYLSVYTNESEDTEDKQMSISMISPVYSRNLYYKFVHRTFEELE